MGHHYVPRRYLRQFRAQDSKDHVWQFDKRTGTVSLASIETVAQERRFYDPNVERDLNARIESPANHVFKKLNPGAEGDLTGQDLFALVNYLATMLMRVPARRNRALALLPPIIIQTVHQTREGMRRLAVQHQWSESEIAAQFALADAYEQRHRDSPPKEICLNLLELKPL